MCGIAGIIERDLRSAPLLKELAYRMAGTLKHRGPDANGVWVDADAGVALGHSRLSIIDLSNAGAQPMSFGRFAISYNGEIYNASELRSELRSRGVNFRGYSDTEVLLKACLTWGVREATQKLIGMFAFAVWDRIDRCLYLVRDRIGIKPLYYSANPKRFSFSSELKALRVHPNFSSEIDHHAIEAFMQFDYVPAPLSIYRDARKLRPGTILCVKIDSLNSIKLTSYWSLEQIARNGISNRFSGTIDEATDELENLFADAVGRRLVSDMPIGAFLSGGIDSSMVTAFMQQQMSSPVQTFSIGFSEGAFDEAPYAKAIARHLGTNHCEHYISSSEVREHGPEIMTHHDEPFADESLFPTYFLSRTARTKVSVALSGDGADEVFGGYARHLMAHKILNHPAQNCSHVTRALMHHIVPRLPKHVRSEVQRFFKMNRNTKLWLSNNDIKVLARGIRNPEKYHHILAHEGEGVSDFATNCINEWLNQCEALSPSERQQYIDIAGFLPNDILTKVDRASMAVSLEVRVPMLDHRIVEFSFRLPDTLKTGEDESKKILRNILDRYIPRSLFERKKRGFGGPIRMWLNGPLREWTRDILSRDTVSRHGLLNPDSLRKNKNFSRNFCRRDFRIICLAAWCDKHL